MNPRAYACDRVIDRYPTLDEVLQAVVDGKDIAAVVESDEFEAIKTQYPTLREGESLTRWSQNYGWFSAWNQ